MRRRLERPDREKELVKRIKTEHSLFKFEKLSETNRTIYDACNQIRVYECLTEYFLYHEHFEPEFVELALEKEDILRELYDLYLKYEMVEVGTWEEIDSLLKLFVFKENATKEKTL